MSRQHAKSLVARLPSIEFPEDRLERLWDETVRRSPWPRWRRMALAAAVFVAVGVAAWGLSGPRSGPALEEARLVAMDQELREVLSLVGQALRRAERTTVENILLEETAPVIDEVLPHERH